VPRVPRFVPSPPCSGRMAVMEASSMEQRRRHLHVADLTCLHCQEKDKRIEWLEESNRRYAENQTKLTEEVSGAQAAARATGKVLDQVTKELQAQKSYVKSLQTKAANRVVTDDQVEAIIDHWCYHRPKTRRAESFPEDGKRRKLILAALKLMADAEGGPVRACCEAIDGLHLVPWQEYDQRFAKPGGPKRVLRNQLEHALGDEQRIERCREVLRKVRGGGAARAWRVYMALGETERAWADEVLDLLREQPAPRERFVYVDGIRVREDRR
jgi:hypothetical protein